MTEGINFYLDLGIDFAIINLHIFRYQYALMSNV